MAATAAESMRKVRAMFPGRTVVDVSWTYDPDSATATSGDMITAWFADGSSADVDALTMEVCS